MSSSGGALRPRYGRIAAFAVSASTTLVTVAAALVVDSSPGAADVGAPDAGALSLTAAAATGSGDPGRQDVVQRDAAAQSALAEAPSTGLRASLAVGLPLPGTSNEPPSEQATPEASRPVVEDTALPDESGTGRRVVFSESRQQVWLVNGDGAVDRTYLVSGSIRDNLDPGTYQVYSRSARATGVDGSTLRWMVRFAHGHHAAIGFHWIPRLHGEQVQTPAQLGTPLSHGCIRQAGPDARAMWHFATVGTTVVVTV